MRDSIKILLCLFVPVSVAAADLPVADDPLTGSAGAALAPSGVCVFGNETSMTFTYGDWIEGSQSFANLFDAEQPACGCADGFKVEAVHMLINFGPEDVPVTFNASASLLETTSDLAGGCSQPGEKIYRSETHAITVSSPGLRTVTVPMDLESCPCARFGYEYAVSFNIHSMLQSAPGIVTSRTPPTGCVSYVTFTEVWYDLAIQFGLGDVVVYADIVCCDGAVPGEKRAWGDVKSLYR